MCWSLRSGAFLEHHDSSFLEVDRQGNRTDRNPPADLGCPEAPPPPPPLQWATGGPGHLRREDTLSLCRVERDLEWERVLICWPIG